MSVWGKDEASVHVRHKFPTPVHVSETYCLVPHELHMTHTAVGAEILCRPGVLKTFLEEIRNIYLGNVL